MPTNQRVMPIQTARGESCTKQGISARQTHLVACNSDPKTDRKRENKSKMHLIQK